MVNGESWCRRRGYGQATQKAEEFLTQMLELRNLQLSIRETLEQIAEQSSSYNV